MPLHLAAIEPEDRRDAAFVAAITAAAWVAQADGWADPTERERLVALLSGFCGREAADSFDTRLRQFGGPDGMALAVHSLRLVAGRSEARLVAACAEQVARADGRVRPAEERAVRLVRRALSSLPPR